MMFLDKILPVSLIFLFSVTGISAQQTTAKYDPSVTHDSIDAEFHKVGSGILIANQGCPITLAKLSILEGATTSNDVMIYDVEPLKALLASETLKDKPELKAFYEKMVKRGGHRTLFSAPSLAALDNLRTHSPNHASVIDDLKKMASLAHQGSESLQFTPLLLLGEPGVGKTHFAKELAKVIGTPFEFIGMGSLTAGWVISGASSQWKGARAGKVVSALINGKSANPLIMVDEIDKAGSNQTYDPLGSLYSLLESETAEHFQDEFAEVEMDASRVLWIATANDANGIPAPILNRMDVHEIRKPSRSETREIAYGIYLDYLDAHPGWKFSPTPSDDVLDKLSGASPRDLKQMILKAFGEASLAKREAITTDDIDLKSNGGKPSIGF